MSNGLVAYYPFNGNANDESGNENNGIGYNATLDVDRFGIPNSSFAFDGNDDYIEIPNSEDLNPTNQITIVIWVKVSNLTNRYAPILHKGGSLSKWFHQQRVLNVH